MDTIGRIVSSLAERPAYLLTFAISFLLFGGSAATGVVGLLSQAPNLAWTGLGLAAITLMAMVGVVSIVEKRSTVSGEVVGNIDFEKIVQAVHQNLRQALGRVHPVFHDRMKRECERFRSLTATWADGQLRTSDHSYNELLVNAYEQAEKNIFATSTLDYLPAWNGRLGEAILKAHRTSKATVTRTFVFKNNEQVSDEVISQMKRQFESGKIEVLVFIEEDYFGNAFPDSINKNFVFIDDGDLIGSTDPAASKDFTGTWHFKEDDHRATYTNIINQLRRGSISFDEFMKSRDPSWKSPVSSPSISGQLVSPVNGAQ